MWNTGGEIKSLFDLPSRNVTPFPIAYLFLDALDHLPEVYSALIIVFKTKMSMKINTCIVYTNFFARVVVNT